MKKKSECAGSDWRCCGGPGFCVAVAPGPGEYEDSEEENLSRRYTYLQKGLLTLT